MMHGALTRDPSHVLDLEMDEQLGIPTFDARDVERRRVSFEKGRRGSTTKLDPFARIRIIIVQAHTRDTSPCPQQQDTEDPDAPNIEITRSVDALDDLEAGRSHDEPVSTLVIASPTEPRKNNLLVRNLPVPIQLAFRQRVLQTLVLERTVMAALVGTALLAFPSATFQVLLLGSPSLAPFLMATAVVVLGLGLVLLHHMRFEQPVNMIILVGFLGAEMGAWVLSGYIVGPYVVVALCSLQVVSHVTMLGLCAVDHRVSRHLNDVVVDPVTAATLTSMILTACCVGVSLVMADAPSPLFSATQVAFMSVVVAVDIIWTGLELAIFAETMTPAENSLAIVFLHADVAAVFLLAPMRWLQTAFHARAAEADDDVGAQDARDNCGRGHDYDDGDVRVADCAASATRRRRRAASNLVTPTVFPLAPVTTINDDDDGTSSSCSVGELRLATPIPDVAARPRTQSAGADPFHVARAWRHRQSSRSLPMSPHQPRVALSSLSPRG